MIHWYYNYRYQANNINQQQQILLIKNQKHSMNNQTIYFTLLINNVHHSHYQSPQSLQFILSKDQHRSDEGPIINLNQSHLLLHRYHIHFFYSTHNQHKQPTYQLILITHSHKQQQLGIYQLNIDQIIQQYHQGIQSFPINIHFNQQYSADAEIYLNHSRIKLQRTINHLQNGYSNMIIDTTKDKFAQETQSYSEKDNHNSQRNQQQRFLSPKRYRRHQRKIIKRSDSSANNSEKEQNQSIRQGQSHLLESQPIHPNNQPILTQSTRTYQPPRKFLSDELKLKKIATQQPINKQIISNQSETSSKPRSHLKKTNSIIIFNEEEMQVHKTKLQSERNSPIYKPNFQQIKTIKQKQQKKKLLLNVSFEQNFTNRSKIIILIIVIISLFMVYNGVFSNKNLKKKINKTRNKK